MKLVDLVERIENVDDELIIFLENRTDSSSNILLAKGEEGDKGIKEENGKTFYYLIEIFLAKEFIEDWIRSLDHKPTSDEIAKRLYHYATYDA